MRREAGRPSISILKLQLLPKAADVPAPVIRRFQFVEPLSELLFERLAGTIASGNANMEVLEALHGRAVGAARSKPPFSRQSSSARTLATVRTDSFVAWRGS